MKTSAPFLHGKTVVGSRGQIVIPHNIRSALDIRAREEMIVFAKDGKIIVMPAKSLEQLYSQMLGNLDLLRSKTSRKRRSARR